MHEGGVTAAGPAAADAGEGRGASWRWPAALGAIYGLVALALLRGALVSGAFPGGSRGEAWGRLFVTAQVGRWARGEAPWLRADLAGWPTPLSFWPTDPLVQALSVPLSALLGDTGALTAVTALLVTLNGVGAYALSRAIGARRLPALAAGLACQLAPYLIRNLTDLVIEVEAVGLLSLAAAALVRASEAPTPRRLGLVGLAVFALAATSPYYAVYLALGAAVVALSQPRRWRTWARLALTGALACGLALAPLALAEGGAHGRLGPQYQGRGYHPSPGALVHASGRRWDGPMPPDPLEGDPSLAPPDDSEDAPSQGKAAPPTGRRGAPPPEGALEAWKKRAVRWPGGMVALLAALVGLSTREGRRWGLLALAFFLGSPAPYRLAALLLGRSWGEPVGLIQELFNRLPLTNTLGNPMRALAPFIALAVCSAALSLSRRPRLALALVALAALEASLHAPWLQIPVTRAPDLRETLSALSGPTIVFPSGDPPVWYPTVYPKEVLFIAGRAGVPVAYDYGRGRTPADLGVQVALARIADAPIGDSAVFSSGGRTDAQIWSNLPFQHLLVLEDRLGPSQRAALRRWLEAHATLLHEQPEASAWTLPKL